MIRLSDRLQRLADRTEPSETMADIGTDHGFLPIYLAEQEKCSRIIMTDISEASAKKAAKNVERCGHETGKKISLRIGSGLSTLEYGEVETVVIAGMGGKLIRDIMAVDLQHTCSFRKFVLQPRIGQGYLRKWLWEKGFSIIGEDLVKEGAYIPEIITALSPGHEKGYADLAERYGSQLSEYSEDDIRWKIPFWITEAQGPVEEFLERNIAGEKRKLENVMLAKSRNLALETRICDNIYYLKGLLKECSSGNQKTKRNVCDRR